MHACGEHGKGTHHVNVNVAIPATRRRHAENRGNSGVMRCRTPRKRKEAVRYYATLAKNTGSNRGNTLKPPRKAAAFAYAQSNPWVEIAGVPYLVPVTYAMLAKSFVKLTKAFPVAR